MQQQSPEKAQVIGQGLAGQIQAPESAHWEDRGTEQE
jgi:hypothetical protein